MVMTRPTILSLVVCLLGSILTLTAAPPAKTRPTAAKAKVAARSAKAKSASRRSQLSYRKAVVRRPAAPSGPSSDRIRLIQQALAERGYLHSEPNGVWSPACIEALKRFEADQNVKVDGKIDAKMLIALGLGPRYDNALNASALGATAAGESIAGDSLRLEN
jgi:peptidoglycan hydrolase-like protein with peptidoglycan-binding domain